MPPIRTDRDLRKLPPQPTSSPPAGPVVGARTAPHPASNAAQEYLPKRRASSANTTGQVQPTSKRPRIVSPFERLPKEIVEEILDNVPNEAGNKLTSLCRTSRSIYDKAFEKTLAKVKAADLVDRARRVSRLRVENVGFSEFFGNRLTEFRAVLEMAQDGEVPLRGKDLIDVLLALAKSVDDLGIEKHHGFQLMLDVLEKLGSNHCVVKSVDAEDRKREQVFLDSAKHQLVHLLSLGSPSSLIEWDKGAIFDRLHDVLKSIESPEIKNDFAAAMSLSEWYFWSPEQIGAERFGKLLKLLEDTAGDLSDISKAKAINELGRLLFIHEDVDDSDIVGDFGRLCALASSIGGANAKANACKCLIMQLDYLPYEAMDPSIQMLFGIVAAIADESQKKPVAELLESKARPL